MSEIAPVVSPNVVAAVKSAARSEGRWRIVARTAFPFLVAALAWEFTAQLGIFPRKLFPPLEEVASALEGMVGMRVQEVNVYIQDVA